MTPAARRTFSCCSSPDAVPPPLPRRLREPGSSEHNSALCCHPRPRPGRRRRRAELIYQHNKPTFARRSGSWMSMQFWVVIVLLGVLSCCCTPVKAGSVHAHGRRLNLRTELVFDRSEPPAPRTRVRRDVSSGHQAHGHHASQQSGDNGLLLDEQGSQLPLPHPFDTSLGNNFTTTSCPAFFDDFLSNQTFIDCLPLSLLLQTSNAFFTASRSLPRLTATLDATCAVNLPVCTALMSSLASQIALPSTCGADLTLQNPVVTQAHNGLLAYAPLYHAGCLKTPATGSYCFANAVTNATAPSSSYIYYLPLGVALPGGTQPACDACLKNTMAVFATYAVNASQPLSGDYAAAAQQLDMSCGPTFVEASSVAPSSGAAGRLMVGRGVVWACAVLVAGWIWL